MKRCMFLMIIQKELKTMLKFKLDLLAKSGALGAFLFAQAVHAASENEINSELLGTFGCSIYNFLTGPLAIWAFILVVVGTLLVGMIARIDFSKIITVVVIFALIQGIGTWAMGVDSIASKLGTTNCLTAS